MPWDSTASINAVALLPGQSSAGRGGPRVVAATDSGLVLSDLKVGDYTAGMSQQIRRGFVGPMATFATGVSASISGPVATLGVRDSLLLAGVFSSAPTSAAPPTWTATNDGPLSHAMTFNGTTQYLNADALLDSLGNDTQGTWTLWVKISDGITTAGTKSIIAFGDTDANERLLLYLEQTGTFWGYCIDAGVEAWQLGSRVVLRDGQNQWKHLALVQNGSSPCIYVDGIDVSSSITGGSRGKWLSNLTGVDNVRIGCQNYNNLSNSGRYNEQIAGAQFYSRALPAHEIKALYQRGLPFIETPSPDTLTVSNRLQFAAADPLSGRFVVGDSSRVELRHPSGALLKTWSGLGIGTLQMARFIPSLAPDSVNVWIGGSTGSRYVQSNNRLTDVAKTEWPVKEYWIGTEAAVVDTSGAGHFWDLGDAAAALSNVGKHWIRLAKGTFAGTVISQSGLLIEGAGDSLSVLDGGVTGHGLSITGNDVAVRGVGARTTKGGGTAYDAFNVTGERFRGEFLRALGSDDDCFVVSGTSAQLVGLRASRCDDAGFLGGTALDNSIITNLVVKDQVGASLELPSGADNNVVGSARLDGAPVDAGSGNTLIYVDTSF